MGQSNSVKWQVVCTGVAAALLVSLVYCAPDGLFSGLVTRYWSPRLGLVLLGGALSLAPLFFIVWLDGLPALTKEKNPTESDWRRSGLGLEPELRRKCEDFVRARMDEFADPSHDFFHVARVRNLAMHIALQEKLEPDAMRRVELIAIFHDVFDWKHSAHSTSTHLDYPVIPSTSSPTILKADEKVGQNPGPIPGPIQGPNAGQTASQSIGQNAAHNADQNACQLAANNVGQNAGQNAGQTAGQNACQLAANNVGQNAAQNAGQTAGQNAGQNVGQNDGQKKAGRTAGQNSVAQSDKGAEHDSKHEDGSVDRVGDVKPGTAEARLSVLLLKLGVDAIDAIRVATSISMVGFKESIGAVVDSNDRQCSWRNRVRREANMVRDADRLEAMGHIGVARAFAFGGRKGVPIFDAKRPPTRFLSKQDYMRSGRSTVVNHFFEKLLLLESGIATATGITIAKSRHRVLVDFVDGMLNEMQLVDDDPPACASYRESALAVLPNSTLLPTVVPAAHLDL
jgi:HD superfamily phosphodiesterase